MFRQRSFNAPGCSFAPKILLSFRTLQFERLLRRFREVKAVVKKSSLICIRSLQRRLQEYLSASHFSAMIAFLYFSFPNTLTFLRERITKLSFLMTFSKRSASQVRHISQDLTLPHNLYSSTSDYTPRIAPNYRVSHFTKFSILRTTGLYASVRSQLLPAHVLASTRQRKSVARVTTPRLIYCQNLRNKTSPLTYLEVTGAIAHCVNFKQGIKAFRERIHERSANNNTMIIVTTTLRT